MKKLLFIFLGFFILCAFTGFNPEDIAALEKGIQKAKQEQDPSKDLCQALENKDQVAVVNILDDNNSLVNADCDGVPPLAYALAYNFQEDIIEFMLQMNANPKAKVDGHYVLEFAIENSTSKVVKLLLQYGAEPRTTDGEDGQFKALKAAIYPNPNINMVKTLVLDGKPELNTIVNGKTILDFAKGVTGNFSAAQQDVYIRIIRFLEDNGAKSAADLK